ncbi:GDP-L-fucose synthase family protein [Streptomyces sp. NPDC013953]|uniref:GDP-L-fucose synthase family protein n=1 Tax=Streptomyces sp. NPDC013953 TaxID=3364868 RepID=UPI0036F520CF
MSRLDRSARVHVAGHQGLVGSAVVRHLAAEGFSDLLVRSSRELDLRDRETVRALYAAERPHTVILAAARVGGIAANAARPVEFLSDNLRIQLNVLDAAREYGVERLLLLGSSCIYPKHAPQPIPESALLTGPLEPTNDAYAIAKITGIIHVQALRRQYGLPYISAMPTNLYGPGDNIDPHTCHVLPAMLRRTHEAHVRGEPRITHWGTGTPRREFLHTDDLARACLFLLEEYDGDQPVNVGTGEDLELSELARLVAEVVGYRGTIDWDGSKPDGTPRKLLDTTLINSLGWKPKTGLREGIEETYVWLTSQLD